MQLRDSGYTEPSSRGRDMTHHQVNERLAIAGEVGDSARIRAAELCSRAFLAISTAQSLGVERLLSKPRNSHVGRINRAEQG
jgi:hypothetical protein